MFSTIFYKQPLLHTTVIYIRHDGARSQVIDKKPLTSVQYANLPMRMKPDEFRHASVNRTSNPGPTHINSGPGSEALVWTCY